MQILLYVLIGLFAVDIIVGITSGIIEGIRASQFNMRLWWLEQQYDKDLTDSVFPEFKENHNNENF